MHRGGYPVHYRSSVRSAAYHFTTSMLPAAVAAGRPECTPDRED